MKKTLSICGGRLIDPVTGIDEICDLHIAGRKIAGIGKAPKKFYAQRTIDAHKQIVCPGLVDLSVHLREPGAEYKATVAGETRAAIANGITTLCCPPDTRPVLDTPAVADLLQQRVREAGMSRVMPLAALTFGLKGKYLSEMAQLKKSGCVGVSNALSPVENTEVLRNAYAYAASCDLTVFIYPRDPWLGRKGCAHEGRVSTRLGLSGIPEEAETVALARELLLVEMTGVRAHFCRLSSARSVEMIAAAQAKGLPISADVSAHQLFLTEMDIADYDPQCHVYPPLRSRRDLDGLREGVKNGVISAICSDHQPHENDAKLSPFALTEPGISALDTLLPLGLRMAQESGMSLLALIGALSEAPAKILGLKKRGLQVGALADVCVFDPRKRWVVSPSTMHSARYNTPFLGWDLEGRVTHTLLAGKLVYKPA